MSFAADGFGPDVTIDDQSGGSEELSMEQLQAQLASEQERNTRNEADLQRERTRLDSFLSRSPQTGSPTPTLQPLAAMPDPAENPDEYRTWLLEKDRRTQLELDSRFEREREERKSELHTAEARASLWTYFQQNHPHHAGLSALAAAAYKRVYERPGMPDDFPGVAKAIAAEMDAMSGTALKDSKKPADRTAGSSGGDVPSPHTPKGQSAEDVDVTIHSAATKFKMDHGLI